MNLLEQQVKKFHHNLDFTHVLERKGINWNRGGGKPSNKILNDIFNHQKRWKKGNNEWIEISQESGFSIKKRYDITKYTTRLEDEGLIPKNFHLFDRVDMKEYQLKHKTNWWKKMSTT